jgi:hypothetical protein
MPFLKLHGIGEPGDGIAYRPVEAQQNGLVPRVIFMAEDADAVLPHFHFEPNEPVLRAGDDAALRWSVEKDIGRIEVPQPHTPLPWWQSDAGAVVEVEADAARSLLRQDLRNLRPHGRWDLRMWRGRGVESGARIIGDTR